MLSSDLCDHISKSHYYRLLKIIGYCYHSVNVINFGLAQSDQIKRLPLHYIYSIKRNSERFLTSELKLEWVYASLFSGPHFELPQLQRGPSGHHFEPACCVREKQPSQLWNLRIVVLAAFTFQHSFRSDNVNVIPSYFSAVEGKEINHA